jgi:amidase
MEKLDRRSFLTMVGALATVPALDSARAQTAAAPASTAGGLAYRSVGELRAMLDARKVSAKELFDQAIARIEMHDAKINAVVIRDFDRARAAAGAADAALARGEHGALLGIPMTVKESFNVGGLPTTWGFPHGRDWKSAEDAVAVVRLKQAGAVILGKTNLATAIGDWQSYNVIYGVTNNPWDVARTAGGSSGGSAAALAAGYVPLELGSDISSPLRMPAHVCGVFSHKPSSDLVPQRGHSPPRSPALQTDLTSGLGVAGPMARSADDLALALDLLAGPDTDQADAWRLSLPPARHAQLRDFRVLVIDDHPLLPVANDIRTALDQLAGRLGKTGATVARSSKLLPDLTETAKLHVRMIRNFAAFGAPPEVFQMARENAATLARDDDSLKAQWIRAPLLSHHEWLVAEIGRARLRAQWRELFREFDVVLCPPFSVFAFPHDHSEPREARSIDIDGKVHPYVSLIVWGTLATPPGLPATVMPIARSQAGLPIGMQIIGPFLEDRTSIAFARLVERDFGGFALPPGMGG